jgi:hypothetical protein
MSFLLTLQTDLKSLRFGKDRPEGGSSQQPYVKTAIPPQQEGYAETMNVLGTPIGTGTDALIRGGISSAEPYHPCTSVRLTIVVKSSCCIKCFFP